MVLGELDSNMQKKKRKKLEHYFTSYTKINSKYIKDLNIRPETIKLKEITDSKLLNTGFGNELFNWTPKERQQNQEEIN